MTRTTHDISTTATTTMKAIQCHQFSGANNRLCTVLSLDDVACPAMMDEDRILVETCYAGVQYPDALQAQGLYQIRPSLPYIPGIDLVGIIRRIGANVTTTRFAIGDRVMAVLLDNGAMAQYVSVHPSSLFVIPDSISNMQRCANIGRNYFAAHHSLKVIGCVKEGDLVLVTGASGGVGMATMELANAMGAHVIAGVSVPRKMLGPQSITDHVLCYGTTMEEYKRFKTRVKHLAATQFGKGGVDLIVDMVQGDLFEAALVGVVRPLGTICLVGFTAGQTPIRPGLLLIKEIRVVGSLWGRYAMEHPERHRNNVIEILNYMGSGKIRERKGVGGSRVFELNEFIRAFELFERNEASGNTMICFKQEEEVAGSNTAVSSNDNRPISRL